MTCPGEEVMKKRRPWGPRGGLKIHSFFNPIHYKIPKFDLNPNIQAGSVSGKKVSLFATCHNKSTEPSQKERAKYQIINKIITGQQSSH